MKALVLVVLLSLLLGSAAGAGSAPTVRVSSATPPTVVGSSFAPRERLRVVVRYDGIRKVRFIRTALTGRFTARFLESTVEDRCSLGASVTRASGRTITAKVPPVLCPPALRP